jgi:hypothetical protein
LTEVLFEPESHVRLIIGFNYCISLPVITIPSSTIIVSGFNHCKQLNEILFDANSSLTSISGFDNCGLLCELTIPQFVKKISGFKKAVKLFRINFAPNSELRELSGFKFCSQLRMIEIPSSVVKIIGFEWSGVCQLTLARGAMLRNVQRNFGERLYFDALPDASGVFLEYAESDLRRFRRRVNFETLVARADVKKKIPKWLFGW